MDRSVTATISADRFLACALLAGALAAGCGDLKTASGGGAGTSSGGDGADGGGNLPRETVPGGTGPGATGALPSGYCCTDDSQCRDRKCMASASGARMCMDACRSQSTCVRRDVTFTCDAGDIGDDGLCQPPLGFQCIPQSRFQRGTRQVGECCQATGDGNAGEECDGNKCIAINKDGQNSPFVCTHRCELTKDCPSGTVCGPLKTCDPANLPYTCK